MARPERARVLTLRNCLLVLVTVLIAVALVGAGTVWLTPPDVDDGVVGVGVTVFDDSVPAVANLSPGLRGALRRAATDAARDDVDILLSSGWRSRVYQRYLLRKAVARYGSKQAAARWVATANTSSHVAGDAVDVGPVRARRWLARHGVKYGLCQIYRNEPWHFELRREAVGGRCPAMYPSPAEDPRMRI